MALRGEFLGREFSRSVVVEQEVGNAVVLGDVVDHQQVVVHPADVVGENSVLLGAEGKVDEGFDLVRMQHPVDHRVADRNFLVVLAGEQDAAVVAGLAEALLNVLDDDPVEGRGTGN